MIFKSLGLYHPFFRPMKRRVLTVAAIVIWGLIELSFGNHVWAMLSLGLFVLCVFAFFVKFEVEEEDGDAS